MLALFAVIVVLGLSEYYSIISYQNHKPQRFVGIIFGLFILLTNFLIAYHNANFLLLVTYFLPMVYMAIYELYRKSEHPFINMALTLFGVLYIAVPFGTINYLVYNELYNFEYNPHILIAVLVLIWTNDSGAYIVGSLIGKHKLFPRISPKKTWEGSIGGAVFAIVASVIIAQYITEIHWGHWIVIGILTVVFSTYGDLTESMLKRKANIKDSGNILPGHGGILDRFDSLLMTAPIVLLYIVFFVKP